MEGPRQTVFARLFSAFILHAEEAKKQNEICFYSDPSKKVLVGGGTGFIGTELCKTLKKKGYTPVIVSRTSGEKRITYDDLERSGLPRNTTAIVNVAGQNVLDSMRLWTQSFKQKVYDSRINTAKALRQAIVKTEASKRPNVFVQVTGIGYFPPRDDDFVYNETSKVEESERDFFSKLVVDWEAAATLPKDCGVRNVFVRPGVVLGRKGGMIAQLFLPFYFGIGGRMGSGSQPMPWIHVKDVCGIIMHAIENEKVSGVLNGVAPQIVTNQEFTNAFASALGRPAFIPMPELILWILFQPERSTMITKGQKVEPKATLESGYQFQYPDIQSACKEFSVWSYPEEN